MERKPPIELQVGERCNVRRSGEPKVREITSAGWIRKDGELWYRWTWRPEGGRDCGYSAVRVGPPATRKKANT